MHGKEGRSGAARGSAGYGRGRRAKTVPVEITVIGTVEAFSRVEVKTMAGGELDEVHFTEGQDAMLLAARNAGATTAISQVIMRGVMQCYM